MNEIINDFDKILLLNDYEKISKEIIILYYKIGKFLQTNDVHKLENDLFNRYGLLIGFTRRNLRNMKNFYNMYKDYDIDILKKINWDNHLIIMKQKDFKYYIDLCLKYNINKSNLRKIVKNGFDIKYTDDKKIYEDVVTLEIISFISSNN